VDRARDEAVTAASRSRNPAQPGCPRRGERGWWLCVRQLAAARTPATRFREPSWSRETCALDGAQSLCPCGPGRM